MRCNVPAAILVTPLWRARHAMAISRCSATSSWRESRATTQLAPDVVHAPLGRLILPHRLRMWSEGAASTCRSEGSGSALWMTTTEHSIRMCFKSVFPGFLSNSLSLSLSVCVSLSVSLSLSRARAPLNFAWDCLIRTQRRTVQAGAKGRR